MEELITYDWPNQSPYKRWRIACAGQRDDLSFDDPADAVARFPESARFERIGGSFKLRFPYRLDCIESKPFARFDEDLSAIAARARQDIAGIARRETRGLSSDLNTILSTALASLTALEPKRRTRKRKSR